MDHSHSFQELFSFRQSLRAQINKKRNLTCAILGALGAGSGTASSVLMMSESWTLVAAKTLLKRAVGKRGAFLVAADSVSVLSCDRPPKLRIPWGNNYKNNRTKQFHGSKFPSNGHNAIMFDKVFRYKINILQINRKTCKINWSE